MNRILSILAILAVIFPSCMKAQSTYTVKITFQGHVMYATLNDNSTSRAFVDRLPMTLPMMNLYGREMCYRFPDALPTDDARNQGYEVGEIVYYPPMHSFVIMYLQNGERFQMQKMGYISSGDLSVFENTGDVNMTFELVNDAGITGIESVEASDVKHTAYNLSGQPIDNPISGIYIVDGKKVLKR